VTHQLNRNQANRRAKRVEKMYLKKAKEIESKENGEKES